MWDTIEFSELRVFLTLAEELHFRRTAERLRISQSRVSQVLRTLEARVGARLFERTSRRVALTPVGEQLRERTLTAYRELERGFEETRAAATGIAGPVRIGQYSPVNGGPHMLEIVSAFKARYPGSAVEFVDTGLVRDQLDWLRTGEVDMLAMRLPLSAPGIVIGPRLARESRVLAVARDHPLAARGSVSYEEVADYVVSDVRALPRDLMNAFIPPRTPSGRPLRRIEQASLSEAIMRVATGVCVHPTVASFPDHIRHPGITTIPIRDLPPSEAALVWRDDREPAKVSAFARIAREVLARHRLVP